MNIQPYLDRINGIRCLLNELEADLRTINDPDPNAATPELTLLKNITITASNVFRIGVEMICSDSRNMMLVSARTAIIKAARNNGITYAMLGEWFNRDHTSMLHLDQEYKARLVKIPEHAGLMIEVVNKH